MVGNDQNDAESGEIAANKRCKNKNASRKTLLKSYRDPAGTRMALGIWFSIN
jgi:hypothetical protein